MSSSTTTATTKFGFVLKKNAIAVHSVIYEFMDGFFDLLAANHPSARLAHSGFRFCRSFCGNDDWGKEWCVSKEIKSADVSHACCNIDSPVYAS